MNIINFLFLLNLLFLPQIIYAQKYQIDSLSSIIESDSSQIKAQNQLADLLVATDPKLAIKHAEIALKLASESKNTLQKSKSIRILLEAYIKNQDIDKINEIQIKATQATPHISDFEKGNINFCKGLLNFKSSSYSDASQNFFEALKYFEKAGAKLEQCKSLNYIGRTFYMQTSAIKAIQYYKKVLKCAQSSGFQLEITRSYNNIAAVLHNEGKYSEAESYFKKSLALSIKNGNTRIKSINYLNLGIVKRDQKDFSKALEYFHKSINISKDKYPRIVAANYNSLSKYYIKTNRIDSAIYYAKKSLSVKNKPLPSSIRASQILHDIYLQKEDTITAYEYERMNRVLSDSFYTKNNLLKSNFTELQYKLNQKEDLLNFQNQKNKLIYSIIGLLMIILGFFGYSIYTRMKLKLLKSEDDNRNIEESLKQKNKELTSKALYLIQKNETMNQISEELNSLTQHLSSDQNKHKIKNITRKLKKNTNEEVWKEFELYFQSVHTNFYRNLQKDFPNLTSNEKKLSAFLCMNMSSKEISAITGQRIATLEVARSRLRKTLGISGQDISLPNFLGKYV